MSGLKGCELESCNESVVNERCALFTPYTSRKNWLWKERLGTRICSSAPTHHFNKQQTKKYIEGRSLRMREFHRFRLREEEILRRRTFYGKMQHITTWIFKQLILCDKVMAISCAGSSSWHGVIYQWQEQSLLKKSLKRSRHLIDGITHQKCLFSF